jgi:EAL domain-containing protein (putative c-di-GMP-specific phosphodiesterase class I)
VRQILASGAIAVAYQPIVSLADRQVWGCEALLRGHTGPLGLIPPPVLVESASRARLLDAVTIEVMEQAITLTEHARAQYGKALVLTLNLEIEQFHETSELLERLVAEVDRSSIRVVLELSERSPLPWTADQERLATELARHGIGVGLDDLGSGESRGTLLGARAWDVVKIDRGLLLENHEGRGPVLLRHLTGILDAYGLQHSVLEGIETPAHERIALELGVRYGQGNGYASAADGPALLRLLAADTLPPLPH